MKTHLSMYLIITIVLSGCAANPTAIPTPSQIVPTLTSVIQQPTLTSTVMVQAVDTATIEVIVPTGTTEPTPTSALVMEIVGDTAQSPVPQPQSCQRPVNWVSYTVQRSDTLSSLAQRTGTSWQQIQSANCLAGTTIFAGQILLLPFIPAPVPPPANTNPSPPTVTIETFPAPDPGNPKLAVTPKEGPAGTSFIFTLDTFVPGETVTLTVKTAGDFREVFKTTVQMSSLGNALVTYQSPANAEPKMYLVDALGAKTVSNDFTITKP